MRLPRKLKKGCRTLNGNPRTKWQRKGRLHIAKTLENLCKTTNAFVVGMDLLRQAAERINPVTFPSGGIVVPPPPKVGVAKMPTGEMVINREHVARLKHAIDINPMDSVRATISAENLSVLDGDKVKETIINKFVESLRTGVESVNKTRRLI